MPKKFAKLFGLLFLVSAIIFYFIGYQFFIPILILGLFSFLEASAGFCIACKIFGILQKKVGYPKNFVKIAKFFLMN